MQGVLRAAQVAGWTDETLAAASGVKPATIKGYRVEGKEPSLAINPIMALIGYAARPLDEADELQPTVLAASALAHLSVIATAAADGRIDHTELPACRDAADQLIATILPISSHGDAA
jgi:hypothetical protein